MKKKIFFVITKSNWGGAQRYVFDLATALPKEKYDVAVVLGGTGKVHGDTGLLAHELQAHAIPVHYIRSFARDMYPLRDLRAFFELLRLFIKERPAVLHLNSSKAGGVGAFAGRLAGVPTIVFTSHGLAYDEDRTIIARTFIGIATWATFFLSHAVILISEETFRRANRLPFVAHKLHRIYNGINPIPFKESAESRRVLATHMDKATPLSGIWVGTISELVRNKGLSYLVTAAAKVKERGLECTLCIIGDGDERERLSQQIQRAGLQENVHLLGFVPEAYLLLKAFNIFTLTSVKEGLPYVLLEAGQAKCAAIGSRISGITDIIEDGATGLLIDAKQSDDIAEKLATLIEDTSLRTRLGEALYEQVTNRFSIQRMTEETVALY